jgi:hypothetical protein
MELERKKKDIHELEAQVLAAKEEEVKKVDVLKTENLTLATKLKGTEDAHKQEHAAWVRNDLLSLYA